FLVPCALYLVPSLCLVPCTLCLYSMVHIPLLSRVAFICNICLVLTLLMRYFSFIPGGDVQSTVIIAGLVLSFVINALVNFLYGIRLARRKNISSNVPVWLACFNFLFLIFQFYLILVK